MGFPDLPVAQPTAGEVKSLHREGDRRSTAVPCHRNAPPWRRPLTPVNTSILESWVEPATRSHLNEDGTLIKCTACGCARACMPCNHNRSVVCICMSHLVDNSIANVGDFSAVAHTRSAAPCPSLEPGAHSDADAPVLPTPTSLRSHVPQTLINAGAPHVPQWAWQTHCWYRGRRTGFAFRKHAHAHGTQVGNAPLFAVLVAATPTAGPRRRPDTLAAPVAHDRIHAVV